MYVCLYVCICIYVYMHIYVCMYVYIDTHTQYMDAYTHARTHTQIFQCDMREFYMSFYLRDGNRLGWDDECIPRPRYYWCPYSYLYPIPHCGGKMSPIPVRDVVPISNKSLMMNIPNSLCNILYSTLDKIPTDWPN